MAHPRLQPTKKSNANQPGLTKLSSEVLRLRLQTLNLPITGSRPRLIERLRSTTTPAIAAAKTPKPGRVNKKSKAAPRQRKRTVQTRQNKPMERTASLDVDVDAHESDKEANSLSDEDSFVDEIQFEADEQCNEAVFTPAQLSAIQHTVSSSVQAALSSLQGREIPSRSFADPSSPRRSNVDTPVGLNRPIDRNLQDKILRGEYIDFSLLLPDPLDRSQSPTLQLRYEDSSAGSQGTPLTLVKRKKAVIDTFHQWLDAFISYMLVIIAAYPRQSLELIKYQQIISKAVTKFKGLAWLTYDEQFGRRAAYDLSILWDTIVL